MLKLILVFILAVNSSMNQNPQNADIVEYVNEPLPGGGYHFRFLTTTGLEREETGRREETQNGPVLRITGYYSYLDSNGQLYKVFYLADELGSKYEGNPSSSTIAPPSDKKHHQRLDDK